MSCDPAADDPRTVHRPVLIVEVLSQSTEARDRGWKFEQYQQLPSLRQYVLVSQNRLSVDSFTRTPAGSWELTPLRKFTDTLHIPSLSLAISVADLYENRDLPPLRLADHY